MTESPLLRAESIHWQAAGRAILSDISFDLPRGSFTGLVGPNGAGKSTLLRCLYKHIQPSSGRIYLNDADIDSRSLKEHARDVAVILQETQIPFGLSVFDVVAMGLVARKNIFSFINQDDRQEIHQALSQVDMQRFSEAEFNHLSGGEKQRVLVARAIVQKPKLLLMDEPTNHLDIHYQSDVLELAKNLDITVLASIHDLNLAAAFCDHILMINQGQLTTQGSPRHVLTENNISSVFKTCALVDSHPLYDCPRITYAYTRANSVSNNSKPANNEPDENTPPDAKGHHNVSVSDKPS